MSAVRTNQSRSVATTETAAAAIVCAAVFFNMLLAFMNANVLAVNRGSVIAGEVLIVVAALAVCAKSANRLMMPWVRIILIMALIFVVLSIGRQSIEPKYFRDVLLIPVFIALGTTFSRGNIVKLICALQVIILAVMVFEGLTPTVFGSVFNPWDYYVQTRENIGLDSWHGFRLYLSAFRPEGRFIFNELNLHRLSSVFLEPVSLGNYCVIVSIYIVTLWRSMSPKVRGFLIISNVIALIGSDGRFAVATSILIIVLSLVARKLPKYLYISYLPGAVVVAVVLVTVFGFNTTADDYPGRLGRSIAVLASFDLPAYFGLNADLIQSSADSGISYFILTQSIVGVGILWLAIGLLQPPNNRDAIVMMHGICIYLSLLMLVSYSLFSIKTAAPIWFLYGYVRVKGYQKVNLTRSSVVHSQQLERTDPRVSG